MLLLSAPFEPDRVRPLARPDWSGVLAVTAILAALAAGLGMEMADGVLRSIGQGMARGAAHSLFLVAGWVIAEGRADSLRPVVHSAAALFAASIASTFTLWGAWLYLVPPVILLSEGGRHHGLRAIGLSVRADLRSVIFGLGAGMFLGCHLLISASQ